MPKNIDQFVAENRRQIRNTTGRFLQADTGRERSLFFGVSRVRVEADVTVSKRDTGDQVVVGHAADSKGFGRGTFGDDKGEFAALSNAKESESKVGDGLSTIASILNGAAIAFSGVGYGYGDGSATRKDDGLETRAASVLLNSLTQSGNTLTADAIVGSTAVVGDTFELSADLSNGDILSRSTFNTTLSDTDELRVDVDVTVEGFGRGNSIFTDAGEGAIASAIAEDTSSTVFDAFAYSETDNIDTSTVTLPDKVFEKASVGAVEGVTTSTSARVEPEDTPDDKLPVDIIEAAAVDGDNTVVWATTFRDITVDADTEFTTEVEYRVS